VLQEGRTPLHLASPKIRFDMVQYLVEQCGADIHAKDSYKHTALDRCIDAESEIAAFLRRYMEPKLKMFALCMGLHYRLGVDGSLRMLNVDVLREIAKHLREYCTPYFDLL
jgi:hypothetical protein